MNATIIGGVLYNLYLPSTVFNELISFQIKLPYPFSIRNSVYACSARSALPPPPTGNFFLGAHVYIAFHCIHNVFSPGFT